MVSKMQRAVEKPATEGVKPIACRKSNLKCLEAVDSEKKRESTSRRRPLTNFLAKIQSWHATHNSDMQNSFVLLAGAVCVALHIRVSIVAHR